MHDMCTDCGGSGIKVTHRPLGPSMMQQIQSVCTDCGGSGDYIRQGQVQEMQRKASRGNQPQSRGMRIIRALLLVSLCQPQSLRDTFQWNN